MKQSVRRNICGCGKQVIAFEHAELICKIWDWQQRLSARVQGQGQMQQAVMLHCQRTGGVSCGTEGALLGAMGPSKKKILHII